MTARPNSPSRAKATEALVEDTPSEISALVFARTVDRLRLWDIDPDPILRDIGVPAAIPESAHARMPLWAFTSLLERAAQQADSPRLGLRLAAELGPEALGPMGQLMLNAPTPLAALRVLERYIATFQDSTIQRVQFNDDGAEFIYLIDDNRIVHRAQDAEFSIALVFQILARHCGEQRPFEVQFEHGPIERWQYYDHYFGCPVYFNQRVNALVFKADALHAPLARKPDEAAQSVRARLDRMLEHRRASTASAIAAYIHEESFETRLTVDQVAKAFGMSVSTLGRRLSREGLSYRTLLDRKRREMAERLLVASELSIAEIALQLGYSENATFSRSFHRWTGISPRQYRKRARQTRAALPHRPAESARSRAEREHRV